MYFMSGKSRAFEMLMQGMNTLRFSKPIRKVTKKSRLILERLR